MTVPMAHGHGLKKGLIMSITCINKAEEVCETFFFIYTTSQQVELGSPACSGLKAP